MKKSKTSAYQSECRAEEIGFTNYERIDETEIFNTVLDKLKTIPNVTIGEKQIGPSEDYFQCVIDGEPFTLFYDVDYGTSIHSDSERAREMIIRCFNEN